MAQIRKKSKYSRAEVAAMSPREWIKYEASLKQYRDSLAIAATNRRKNKQAKEEGLAVGHAQDLV